MQNSKNDFNSKELKIFPNPSSGHAQLVFSGLTGNEFTVEVIDILGQIVLNKCIGNVTNTYLLQLSGLKDWIIFTQGK